MSRESAYLDLDEFAQSIVMTEDGNTIKNTLTSYSRAVLGDETNRQRQASFDKLTNGVGRTPSSGINSAGAVEIMTVDSQGSQGIAQGYSRHSTAREARGPDVAHRPLTASTSAPSASATAFVSSPSTSPSRSLATRHRASSSTSSIPNFQHPVHLPSSGYIRSQPLGVASKASTRAALAEQGEYAPTLSGGVASHRLSVSSSSSSLGSEDVLDDEDEAGPSRIHDPRKYESDSEVVLRSSASGQTWDRWKHDLEDLPPNPKLWLPSHLSLYLSAHLSLHPLLSKDITEFIKKSRLSGRTFLRLRDEDMEEMGINLRWRRALSDAREVLNKAASDGRLFWGFEGGAAPVAVKDSDGGKNPASGAALNRDLDGAHLLLGLSTSVRSASSALSASTARTRRLAGSSSGSSGSGSTCDSRPPSVGSGMPYLRSQSPPQSHASGTTARSYSPPLLRRNSSPASSCALEVEGQNQLEDDLIKEEWKQSWKRLLNYSASSNGGRGAHRGSRVRGMASVFERVDEGSRESSPVKSRSGGSPKVTRREKKGSKHDAPVQKESRCRDSAREARGHGMQDSIDSNASNASVNERTFVQQLQQSRNVHAEFHLPSRKTSRTMDKADEGGYPTARPLPTRTASMRTSAIDVFSMGSAIPLDSEFDRTQLGTSLKRFPSPISAANATEVKTIRGPFASTSSANPHPRERVPSNPPTTRSGSRMSKEEKRRSLATLFDLEIPRVSTISTSTSSMTRRSTIVGADGADDLVEWEIGATQGKRGSMVLVKRSQLEALARRMDEVEEALAASIHGGSEAAVSIAGDLPDPIRTLQSRTSSNAREEQDTTTALEALTQRLASLENRLLPAPAHHPLPQQQHHAHACNGHGSPSPSSMYESSPQATARVDAAMSSWVAHQLTLNEIEASRQARANALDRQHRDRMDAASLHNSARSREASHDIMAYRRDGEDGPKAGRAGDPGMGPGGPLSWSFLGGYVVAASIGIGIVAGEVVAAKLFNVRAGHH